MSNGKYTRRQLLKASLFAGAGASLLGGPEALMHLARGAEGDKVLGIPDRHYVFCYFPGGWDIILGLDPKDPELYKDDDISTTLVQPAYNRLDLEVPAIREPIPGMQLGPHMGNLYNHADKMCIVRGMSMETLTHDVGRRRFLTGRAPLGLNARGSSTDVWLASQLGAAQAIPNLVLNVESYNKDQPSYATGFSASQVDDLVRALKPGTPAFPDAQAQRLHDMLAISAQCPEAQQSKEWLEAEAARLKAVQMIESKLDSQFAFQAKTPEMEILRDFYGLPNNGRLDSPAASAAVAATAIKNGISRVVSIAPCRGLDTHFQNWETDHGEFLQEGYDAVALLVEDLAKSQYKNTGDTWLDHTVIIGFSEFSRTPLINPQGGRDHWLLNACFLMGGNIAGGKVIGRSSDIGMNPTPVDPETGVYKNTIEGGIVPRPEHVLQALYEEVGLTEEPDLRIENPLNAIFK